MARSARRNRRSMSPEREPTRRRLRRSVCCATAAIRTRWRSCSICRAASPGVARAADRSDCRDEVAPRDLGDLCRTPITEFLCSVLLLAPIGLAITFGVMGVINMAHGEIVMTGAYVTFVVQEIIRASNPALFDYSLAIAIPLAFLVAGLVGILIERCIIRFLYGRPLETLLATWGLSLVLQQVVRTSDPSPGHRRPRPHYRQRADQGLADQRPRRGGRPRPSAPSQPFPARLSRPYPALPGFRPARPVPALAGERPRRPLSPNVCSPWRSNSTGCGPASSGSTPRDAAAVGPRAHPLDPLRASAPRP